MSNRRTLYIPDKLWERMVRHVAREQAETGSRVSVSAFVRRVVTAALDVDDAD